MRTNIEDVQEIFRILQKCQVCRLAMFAGDYPYIIPVNFGAAMRGGEIELYFHGKGDGTKIELLRRNNHAAFEMDCGHQLVEAEDACRFSMKYESVCGHGAVEFLSMEEKADALAVIMRQYAPGRVFGFLEKQLQDVTVMRLNIHKISGKRLE